MKQKLQYVKQPKDYFLGLKKHKKNIFSQNGEDGVIAKLLEIIGVNGEGWCCEFGAWDGKHLSNTYNLIKNKNWKSVLIESDEQKFKNLQTTQSEHPDNIIAVHSMVHYLPGVGETLDDILSKTAIPTDFEVLSIDVDGPDYHIWKSLEKYKPKIVIIEHSGLAGSIIQREGAIHKKDIDGSTSFEPIRILGEEKGYRLVVDLGNMIFLDEDIAKGL